MLYITLNKFVFIRNFSVSKTHRIALETKYYHVINEWWKVYVLLLTILLSSFFMDYEYYFSITMEDLNTSNPQILLLAFTNLNPSFSFFFFYSSNLKTWTLGVQGKKGSGSPQTSIWVECLWKRKLGQLNRQSLKEKNTFYRKE